MFLDPLVRRNPRLPTAAIQLHQSGHIPPNSYVLDVDQIEANAQTFARRADELDLHVLPMTKQLGRNPAVLDVLATQGIGDFVVVDTEGARQINEAGHEIGHVGHLVQVPRDQAVWIAGLDPQYWTVFTQKKAREAAAAAAHHGRTQDLLLRIYAEGDTFYMGHEGGVHIDELVDAARAVDALEGARFSGITTFPALLYDDETQEVQATPNLRTLERALELLAGSFGRELEVNAPGTTSTEVLPILGDAGATQVEPGHGLTGTTPLHAIRDLPELPAVCYLTEISHQHEGTAYCFGGGLYIDPVFPHYQVRALVGADESALDLRVDATLPPPSAIDYYGLLDPDGRTLDPGDSVVFGFRIQAFVTRAHIAPLRGLGTGEPEVVGVWSSQGQCVDEPWA